jgi:phosphoglycolate phosphatase
MHTIVFDLDGTLVDSAPDLISTLNLVLAGEGLPPVGYDAARRMIGGGSRRMIERALIAQGRNVPAAGTHVSDLHRPLQRAYCRSLAPVPPP